MKGTETFQRVIKEYLDKRAVEDELFAKDYQKPGKDIEGCCDFIISEVKKSGRQGFADEEVFGLAVHYYNEDVVEYTKQKCTVVVNLSDQTKESLEKRAEEEFKQAKIAELRKKEAAEKERSKAKAEAQKKKEEAEGQLSLFDF